jgi:glutamate synthase domain-containing protein 3
MSGGIAYVYDPNQDFDLRCNLDMVDIEPVEEPKDIGTLRSMIERHHQFTGSAKAAWMLHNWDKTLSLFVKVMPMEYRRALGQMAAKTSRHPHPGGNRSSGLGRGMTAGLARPTSGDTLNFGISGR